MRTAPTNWNTVINGADPWWYEASLFVQRSDDPTLDYTYAESEILSIKTKRMVFDDHPAIGVCYSAEIDAEFIQKTSVGADPPTNGKISPRVRVNNGTTASNWLFTNSYYIDTRSTNHTASGFDTLTIHGYDAMRFADAPYATSSLTWPAPARQVVAEIATAMGVTVHPDTGNMLTANPKNVDSPIANNKTYRDVLSEIGVMYCGNWIIGGNNYLNMFVITRDATPNYPSVNITPVQKYSASPQYNEFEGVILTKDEEGNAVTSGDPTGYAIEAYLPNATQTEADDILADLAGWHYKPFEADGALLTPLAELQDQIQMNDGNGETFVIYGIETTFGRLMSCTVCAPSDEEVQHEFAFEPASERRYQTTLGGMTSSITQNANRIAIVVDPSDDSIKAASIVTAINDAGSSVEIEADHINLNGAVTANSNVTIGVDGTITAVNANISGTFTMTGGSINITTASETYDAINLSYNNWSSQLSPLQLLVANSGTNKQFVIQAGGIFGYDPIGTQKIVIGASGNIVTKGDITADGSITAGEMWVGEPYGYYIFDSNAYTRGQYISSGITFMNASGTPTAYYPADMYSVVDLDDTTLLPSIMYHYPNTASNIPTASAGHLIVTYRKTSSAQYICQHAYPSVAGEVHEWLRTWSSTTSTWTDWQRTVTSDSDLYSTSGTTATYTLQAGNTLISTARQNSTSAAQDGLWLACVGASYSHITAIKAPSGTTTATISGSTLTVTTGAANVRVTVTHL